MFPNAELIVPDTDCVFWHDDANLNRAPEGMKPFFLGARKVAEGYANRLRRFSGESDIIGAIRSVPLPGHTPGHAGFILESDGKSLFIWADVVHIAAYQLARPEWGLAFDTDPLIAAATRRLALERASGDRMLGRPISCFRKELRHRPSSARWQERTACAPAGIRRWPETAVRARDGFCRTSRRSRRRWRARRRGAR